MTGAFVFVWWLSALLAAVALKQVHRVDGNRIAANGVVVLVVHDVLPRSRSLQPYSAVARCAPTI
jgi:hypothetical protein